MPYLLMIFLLITSVTCLSGPLFNVNTLSLDQKIGQLFMVAAVIDPLDNERMLKSKDYRLDREYITDLIMNYHIGGIIWLGVGNPEAQRKITEYFNTINDDLHAIPLWFGQDLEPQFMSRFGFPVLPNAQTIGQQCTIDEIIAIGQQIGSCAQSVDVQVVFAPMADVHVYSNNTVTLNRSFGNNPLVVADHVVALAHGIESMGVLACAKHFPGHGHTTTDSHYGLPIISLSLEELQKSAFIPFQRFIEHQFSAIMVGHLACTALDPSLAPATVSWPITSLLRETLGFQGIVFSDALDMKALKQIQKNSSSHNHIAVAALQAGCDVLLCPSDIHGAINAIKQALADGSLTMTTIDNRVKKVLWAKEKARCISDPKTLS